MMATETKTDNLEYDDEEKHVLASNDPLYVEVDDEEENNVTVMFQSNDVDTMNYDELYIEDDDHEQTQDLNLANNTESNFFPISGLRIHEDAVSGISSSSHQALIASVGDDYRLILYKINSEHRLQCIRRIKKKYLPVSVSFDNTGDCLAISMIDGVIEVWDVCTMKPIYTLKGHTGSVLKSIWCPSHRNTLASFSNDKTIRIWHPHSMPSTRSANIIQLKSNTLDIEWQKTNSSDTLLASVDNKNTLRLYSSANDYKQIYVGRSMGDKLAFGQQSLIAVNGYNLNLFDCANLNRLNCLKANKYHSGLINNVSLQHVTNPLQINQSNSQSDAFMSYSRSLFATTDKSQNNTLCIWQFNDDCTNSRCIGRILNAHNCDDRKIYSLKIKEEKKNKLPIPTAFDDESQKNEQSDEENEEFNDDKTDFVTNLSFCKHVPQYLLSSGKDGTIKLWDCNQLNDAQSAEENVNINNL